MSENKYTPFRMPSPGVAHAVESMALPAGARLRSTLARWFDTDADAGAEGDPDRIDWLRALPFFAMHVACLGVFWVGTSTFAVATAAVLYAVRMFAITGFYHRYFAHKTFCTSRAVQFLFAVIGSACVQRGPLWWAAHHRNHHRHADTPRDLHSPRQGFLWSHMGWFLTRRAFRTDLASIGDFAHFRELRLLDRFDIAVPVVLAVALYFLSAHGWPSRTRASERTGHSCWCGVSSCRRSRCSTRR